MTSYLLLFLSAFGAATILPFASEATLIYLLGEGGSIWLLWLVATLGNTLGSFVNWWIGLNLLRFKNRRWFPVSHDQLRRGQDWFQRYGFWSLLLSWLPIVGDALTVVAGACRVSIALFSILVFIAKGTRYAAVIYLYLEI